MLRIAIVLLSVLVANLSFAAEWTVDRVRGQAEYQVGGSWLTLMRGQVIENGVLVQTGGNGRVDLVRGAEAVSLGANTQIQIRDAGSQMMTTIIQTKGIVTAEVERRNVQHFSIQTPYLVAVVKGTRFVVAVDGQGASVDVERGVVQVQDNANGFVADIRPGQEAVVTASTPLAVEGRNAQVFTFDGTSVVLPEDAGNGDSGQGNNGNGNSGQGNNGNGNSGQGNNGNGNSGQSNNGNGNSGQGNNGNANGNSGQGNNGNGNGNSGQGNNGNGNGNSGQGNNGNGNGNSGQGNNGNGNGNSGQGNNGNGNGNSGQGNNGNGNGNSGQGNNGNGNGNSGQGNNGNGNGNSGQGNNGNGNGNGGQDNNGNGSGNSGQGNNGNSGQSDAAGNGKGNNGKGNDK